MVSSNQLLLALAAGLALTSFYSVNAIAQEADASGEVRRVDVAGGKVTIKHGAIADLELPAMTLVYKASPDILKDIKPGDQVKFTARRQAGQYTVVKISK